MISRYTLTLVAALLVFATCAQANEGDVIWRDSFEKPVDYKHPSYPLSPVGWFGGARLKDGDVSVTVVADPVADGKQSLRIAAKKRFNMVLRSHRYPRVKPSTVYTMSIKVMFDSEDGPGGVSLMRDRIGYDPYLPASECKPKTAPKSGGFKEFSFTFMTGPAQDRIVQSHIYVEPMPGAVYLDDLHIVEGGEFKPTGLDKPLPTDRLLPVKHKFSEPDLDKTKKRFEALHQESEKQHRGNGQWEGYLQLSEGYRQKHNLTAKIWTVKHALLRSTTQRIIGYLGACSAMKKPIYLERVREGLEWLLTEQQPDGGFLFYGTEEGIGDREYYDTGIAGAALVEGYLQFKDKRYLDAAERVAVYGTKIERSWNFNYNMFLIWAGSRHSLATGDFTRIEPILKSDKLQYTLDFQRPWGGHSAHNSRIGYHGINLRGLLALYQALPKTPQYNALREQLRAASVASVNRYVVEQCPHGGLPFERGKPETARANPSIVPALIMANEVLGLDTRDLIYGVMDFYGKPEARGDLPHWTVLSLFQSTGQFLRWVTSQTKAGE